MTRDELDEIRERLGATVRDMDEMETDACALLAEVERLKRLWLVSMYQGLPCTKSNDDTRSHQCIWAWQECFDALDADGLILASDGGWEFRVDWQGVDEE